MGFYQLDLWDFNNMLDWIMRLSAPVSFDLTNPWASHPFDKTQDWVYLAFTLEVEYAGEIIHAREFQHEVRIYPYGIDGEFVYAKKISQINETKEERQMIDGKVSVLNRNRLSCRYDINSYEVTVKEDEVYGCLSDYYDDYCIKYPKFKDKRKEPIMIMLGRFVFSDGNYFPSSKEGNRYFGMKINLRVPQQRSPKRLFIWTKTNSEDEIKDYKIKG